MAETMARSVGMVADLPGQGDGVSDAPIDGPTDDMLRSEPLGDEDVVLENENAGATRSRGGGEYPDPDTPPSGVAPGDGAPARGQGQFDEAYEETGSERSGSGS
jgi:hypothetical protein